MRILIAGGGGFIGSALVKYLSTKHSCVCFGHGGRFGELQQKIDGDAEYVEGDVTDAHALRGALKNADAVIYAAGTGGEADCLENPTQSLLAHVYGTHLLSQEVQRQQISKFIFTSTIAVYGTYRARPMPLTEEMDVRPDEFYGALKATAEHALIDSGRFQILRLANVFGYGSGLFSLSSGVAGRFVDQANRGGPLRVFGDGSQSIDYVHIDDVCRAYELALNQSSPQNFVINIGGGEPVSILDLAQTVARVAQQETGNSVAVEQVAAPPDKIWPDRWLSIDKARRELGWQPQVSIEDGIREMVFHSAQQPVEV